MKLAEFIDTHAPALERDEARHNMILGVLGWASRNADARLETWTLGGPGACAICTPGRPIILGELDRDQCRALAEATHGDHVGVIGPDAAPGWFVERAGDLGAQFEEPVPQRIYALHRTPVSPGSPGRARKVTAADAALFADWMLAFAAEAVPHDPPMTREDGVRLAGEDRHMFWIVDDQPVAMAGIARRLRTHAAISAVYTPPSDRGRGFAGSITAAVAERIFAEGRRAACLYTDLRNPASNRCYVKIGFEPVCASWVYPRRRLPT